MTARARLQSSGLELQVAYVVDPVKSVLYVTGEGIDAQRGQVSGFKSHGWWRSWGLNTNRSTRAGWSLHPGARGCHMTNRGHQQYHRLILSIIQAGKHDKTFGFREDKIEIKVYLDKN